MRYYRALTTTATACVFTASPVGISAPMVVTAVGGNGSGFSMLYIRDTQGNLVVCPVLNTTAIVTANFATATCPAATTTITVNFTDADGHTAQIVVDKSGTITKGKPEVVSVHNFSNKPEGEIIAVLASLEKRSEHPLAHAVLSFAEEKKIAIIPVEDFSAVKGKGVTGRINNTSYLVGNVKFMEENGVLFEQDSIKKELNEGKTPIILAADKKVLCVVMIADAIKPEAVAAVAELHKLGLKVVMLTGDNKYTAEHIAHEAGIDEVIAEATPEDKQNAVKKLQSEGKIVAMAGDGVNDAPALAQADVGIAMATGTDVAIESAGITLLHGDISKLVKAINLSRITMLGIKQNLFWAFIYNIIGIPLAAGVLYPFYGWMLSPVFAGAAMAFSSVSVVLNSLRIKTKKI